MQKKKILNLKYHNYQVEKNLPRKLKHLWDFCEDAENLMETAICYFDGNVFDEPVQGLKNESLTEEKFKNSLDTISLSITN